MKEIQLTQGMCALVDDEDYIELSKYKWFAHRRGSCWYATRKLNGKQVHMHNEVFGKKNGFDIDHKDGNSLNNQKKNLRYATRSQNCCNRKMRSDNTSGYRGVHWESVANKWRVNVSVNGKRKNVGLFTSVVDAASAYDKAAKEVYGEFARVNIKDENV